MNGIEWLAKELSEHGIELSDKQKEQFQVVYPELKVTIVDSLNKRIQFLNHLAAELGLTQVSFVHIALKHSVKA